jgi:hypothetical protein
VSHNAQVQEAKKDSDATLCHELLKNLCAHKVRYFCVGCVFMGFLDCQTFTCNCIIHFMVCWRMKIPLNFINVSKYL